jgi:hypothetical protein
MVAWVVKRTFLRLGAGDEMTLLIEAAMDLGMNSAESIDRACLARRLQKNLRTRSFDGRSRA